MTAAPSDVRPPEPGPSGAPLLSLDGVSAAYGAFRALFDVSLDVPERSVVALLGPNGSGKTTVARVCSGLVEPTSGRILVDGEDVTGAAAWRFPKRGIIHAPEGRSVFASLTVEENLELYFRQAFGKAGLQPALERAYEEFPRLGDRRSQLADTLSGGEQRMLSLARVLVSPPRLLIVDELSLGLAPLIVDQVFETLTKIREAGAAILVIEQQVDRALALADEAVLLMKGQVVFRGSPEEAGAAAQRLLPGGGGG